MRQMQLNEGYGIIVNHRGEKKILFVDGKKVSANCALTFNFRTGYFSFTFIGTGIAIDNGLYKTASAAMRSKSLKLAKEYSKYKKDPNKLELINKAKEFYENLIENKKFAYD